MTKSLLLSALLLATALAASAADGPAAPQSKENLVQGGWKFTTVGQRGAYGQNAKALGQTFTLTFNEKPAKGKAIEGKPFGFEIVASRLAEAKPAGNISFTTSYKMTSLVPVTWHGKLSAEGTKITDGKFSFMLGSGTFTAEKLGAGEGRK